jgi:coenzyme Q-binding protein COQ10
MLKGFLRSVSRRHVERKILGTNPIHLFRIIVDVDQYSKFLPLCSHSKVLRRSDSGTQFDATLTVGLPPFFQDTYVSSVAVSPEDLTVTTISTQSKLFDSIESRWKLLPFPGDDSMCNVDFEVAISASDPLIVATLDQVLQEVAGRQVAAFEARCAALPLPTDINPFPRQ